MTLSTPSRSTTKLVSLSDFQLFPEGGTKQLALAKPFFGRQHAIVTKQALLIISLYLVFGLFEIPFRAEPGHTVAGRMRNIVYAAILLLSTFIYAKLIGILIPFQARELPDRGVLFSIFILMVYLFLFDLLYY